MGGPRVFVPRLLIPRVTRWGSPALRRPSPPGRTGQRRSGRLPWFRFQTNGCGRSGGGNIRRRRSGPRRRSSFRRSSRRPLQMERLPGRSDWGRRLLRRSTAPCREGSSTAPWAVFPRPAPGGSTTARGPGSVRFRGFGVSGGSRSGYGGVWSLLELVEAPEQSATRTCPLRRDRWGQNSRRKPPPQFGLRSGS